MKQDDYIPTSVVDGSEASGRKGNSKKLAVWDKPEISLSKHSEYKLICCSSVFPLSLTSFDSSPAGGGAFWMT